MIFSEFLISFNSDVNQSVGNGKFMSHSIVRTYFLRKDKYLITMNADIFMLYINLFCYGNPSGCLIVFCSVNYLWLGTTERTARNRFLYSSNRVSGKQFAQLITISSKENQ